MANVDAILDVSNTLVVFLRDATQGIVSGTSVILQDPVAPPTNVQLPAISLFLYEVEEDTSARNRPRSQETNGSVVTLRRPAMALALRYLITPYPGTPGDEQLIIGRILLAFYDHAILSGPDLQGSLKNTDAALKVSLFTCRSKSEAGSGTRLSSPFGLR
jgi:hypothetical protein